MQPVRRLLPASTRVTKHRVTDEADLPNLTTFEDLEFPSISTISLHDFSRSIEGRKIRSGFSNGIPFFKFILSPYPRRGSFISANNQLGTGWTRVTIRIVPAGQRRQR